MTNAPHVKFVGASPIDMDLLITLESGDLMIVKLKVDETVALLPVSPDGASLPVETFFQKASQAHG